MEDQCFRKKKGRVLVVGAGVIGLTTALKFVEQGYRVRVMAREFVSCNGKSKLTSQVAAAFWGINTWPGCEEKMKDWCLYGYDKFVKLAENPQYTGVFIRELVFIYPHLIDSEPHTKEMKSSFQKYLPGNPLRHDKNLIKEKGLSSECGLVDAMSIHVPLIETDMFMYWLTQQCISKGVDFVQGTVDSLLENCDSLRRTHGVECIVNCTGLAAGQLVQDDTVYPMLGVALALRNGDRTFDFPTNCAFRGKVWYREGTKAGEVAIVPRGEHSLWLGTMLLESYDKNIGLKHPAVQRMLEECQAVYPPLRNINQDDLHVTVGIRPMRRGGPRIQQDPRYPFLLHNYGHANSGIMTSWGSAVDVFRIFEKSLCSKL